MFDHITIRVSDRQASRRFYETVLLAIGLGPRRSATGIDQWWELMIAQASAERPVTRGLHVAFVTRSAEEVDTFWRAGTRAGYTSDGEPGPRPQYSRSYYGSFLLDPDGNSVEAVWHGRPRRGQGIVDHLWIRVADLQRSRRFYAAVAPAVGLTIDERAGDRDSVVHVRGEDRSFALVQDERPVTENLHLAFPVRADADVEAFHVGAVAAGGTDNGEPGERARYHSGYYAGFVLDPDGNNVEAVCHNR
jgi:catechol 2,3-dioxygenase-like lactoylglutathione lyase family enzyme